MRKLVLSAVADNSTHVVALAVGPDLEIRASLVVNPDCAVPVGVDLRLYRRLLAPDGAGPFAQTPAGLRIPRRLIADLAIALVRLGRDGTNMPAQSPAQPQVG